MMAPVIFSVNILENCCTEALNSQSKFARARLNKYVEKKTLKECHVYVIHWFAGDVEFKLRKYKYQHMNRRECMGIYFGKFHSFSTVLELER